MLPEKRYQTFETGKDIKEGRNGETEKEENLKSSYQRLVVFDDG